MAARPSWQGHLRLSLVTCPVALYRATGEAGDVHFHLIDPKTKARIRMQAMDINDKPIERGALVKGYEVAKGQYVLLDKEDFEAVKLESTRVIDIEEFVDVDSIDRLYWDQPYYLAPNGKTGIEAFSVIKEAMSRAGKVALGRLVMSTRERICALEPREEVMVLTTLRARNEVRDVSEIVPDVDLPKPQAAMLDIAAKIIEQGATDFDPNRFTDRYENALREIIARKQKGMKITAPAPAAVNDNADDLMELLRRSIAAPRAGGEPARRTPAARAPGRGGARRKPATGRAGRAA